MAKLLKVNVRGQVSLGKLAQHEYYEARVDADGRIYLDPVVVVARPKDFQKG